MDESLDSFLFDRMDVYLRLREAFREVEQGFWETLGGTVGTIADELLGDDFANTFGEGFWQEHRQGYAYNRSWKLELEGERESEWESFPSLWFPQEVTDDNLFSLLGLGKGPAFHMSIWAQPLSQFAGDLTSVRSIWEGSVAAALKEKGWVPYGERVSRPNGDWGLRHPVVLNHREIADGLRKDDLRLALAPIEKLINDFASVCPAITQMVEKLREKRG